MRSPLPAFIALSLLVILTGCALPPQAVGNSNSDPSLRAEVLAELERYYADFSARDWTKFVDHFWPGATEQKKFKPSSGFCS